jgi:mannose-6-phosphate isomerase
MKSLYPLKFKPVYRDKIWGGQRIRTLFGHDFGPLPNCGEAWLLSGVEGNNTLIANGFLSGNELNELVEIYMDELVGEAVYENFGNSFPLLFKIIDAREWLSIQVHPDDILARARGLQGGKTEMWYIMDAAPEAQLIAGFNRNISRFEYQSLLKIKKLQEVLNFETVQTGDVFYMPAGRIHALGPGVLLAEIQQTSDTTYRIYDWDRVDAQGNERELHLELALDAIDYNTYPDYRTHYTVIPDRPSGLIQTPHFTTNLLQLGQTREYDYAHLDSFVVLLATEGQAEILSDGEAYALKAGEAMLLPAGTESITIRPGPTAVILETYIETGIQPVSH